MAFVFSSDNFASKLAKERTAQKVVDSLGTETIAPTNGTGVRGWLQGIYSLDAKLIMLIETGKFTVKDVNSDEVEEHLDSILDNQTNGLQKTQIVDAADVNLGTLANPVFVSGSVISTPSGIQDENIKQVGGTNQTPRDWSGDFAHLGNIETNTANILTQLQNMKDFEESIWIDSTNTVYIRTVTKNEQTGANVITYTLPDGTAYTPVAPISPASSRRDIEFNSEEYKANAGGTGYSTGNLILHTVVYDTSQTSPSPISEIWYNLTTLAAIGTPTPGTIDPSEKNTTVYQGTDPWIVSGKSAVGTIPANNPVSVSGVDAGGLKRHILTDIDGTVEENQTKIGGAAISVNIGNADNGTQRMVVASNQPPIPTISTSSPIVVDANNSTTTPLAAGASFIGTATNILAYQQQNISLYFAPNVVPSGGATTAKASFFFDYSDDATNWDIQVPAFIRSGIFIPYSPITVKKYFRVRYINDGGASAIANLGLTETAGIPTTQTLFRLTTLLLPNSTKDLARTVDQPVSGSDPVTLNRGVLMGKDPNGTYVNLPATGVHDLNSSTTLLLANATFSGTYVNLQGYVGLSVIINTDVTGTVFIDNSIDGVTVDRTVSFSITGGATFTKGLTKLSRYVKIRYTNGDTNQSTFRLQTILTTSALNPTSGRADEAYSDASVLASNKSILTAKNTVSGSYTNVTRSATDTSNNTGLHVAIQKHEVATPILALTAYVTGQANIASTTVAVNVIPSPTTGRKSVCVKAASTNTKVVFVGASSAVTSGSGYELSAGESLVLEIDETTGIWVIGTTSASQNLQYIEIS